MASAELTSSLTRAAVLVAVMFRGRWLGLSLCALPLQMAVHCCRLNVRARGKVLRQWSSHLQHFNAKPLGQMGGNRYLVSGMWFVTQGQWSRLAHFICVDSWVYFPPIPFVCLLVVGTAGWMLCLHTCRYPGGVSLTATDRPTGRWTIVPCNLSIAEWSITGRTVRRRYWNSPQKLYRES